VNDQQARHIGAVPGSEGRIALSLLGGFSLTANGEPLRVPMSEQRLLAFLAVNGRPLLRSYVAAALWLDSSETHALGNLRSAIWRLHHADVTMVRATRTHVALGPTVEADLTAMVGLATALIHRSAQIDPLEVDERGLTGELLPGWYDDWVLLERERIRQLQLHALDALCHRLLVFGHHARAVHVGLAAIESEPLRESAHRLLIEAHLAEGNVAEAARQYEMYRSLLVREMGIEPSPTLKRLATADGLLSTA
jgi:DNA-binding SARP family transcriptional activator